MYDRSTRTITLHVCNKRFIKSKIGKKCNVVRVTDTLKPDEIQAIRDDEIRKIRVINRATEEWFERIISDISRHPNIDDSDIYVFSWYHQALTYDQIELSNSEQV